MIVKAVGMDSSGGDNDIERSGVKAYALLNKLVRGNATSGTLLTRSHSHFSIHNTRRHHIAVYE